MRFSIPLTMTALVALSACSANQPPQIGELVPAGNTGNATAQQVSQTVVTGFDQTYSTNWSCRWDGPEATWSLPVVDVEDGEAYAFNEWTRLEGVVREPAQTRPEAAGKLELTGERRSEEGGWYSMTMVGPVYADRPSTLRGYWKGAQCEALMTPVQAEASL